MENTNDTGQSGQKSWLSDTEQHGRWQVEANENTEKGSEQQYDAIGDERERLMFADSADRDDADFDDEDLDDEDLDDEDLDDEDLDDEDSDDDDDLNTRSDWGSVDPLEHPGPRSDMDPTAPGSAV